MKHKHQLSAWWWEVMIGAPGSHWADHELLWILKNSRVKSENICLTDTAWTKLGHSTGWWSKKSKVLQCSSQAPSTWLRCCVGTLRELRINECLQTSMNWSNTAKKGGLKFPTAIWETEKVLKKMSTNKIASTSYWWWGVNTLHRHFSHDCIKKELDKYTSLHDISQPTIQ